MAEIQKARETVKELREQVNNGNSKPLEGIAKHRLIDKLQGIVELKEERIEIVDGDREFDLERLNEINEEQEELIRELKEHGVPHHPVMGSKQDYRQVEVNA